MIQTLTVSEGVTLHAFHDTRFKQSCMSIQFVTPMDAATAAENALIPAVLLQGTRKHPTLRAITEHLDSLYGAAVSPMVRRVGDHQAVGLYCAFMEDRFALDGDRVLAPMVDFLRELLLDSPLEDGHFLESFVKLEKKNQISAIESEGNDKRHYAVTKTLEALCAGDSFAIPRMGTVEAVAAITAEGLYRQYQVLLSTAPVDIFYVGSREPSEIAELLKPIFAGLDRHVHALPVQAGLNAFHSGDFCETQEVAQGKLCMSFVSPVTNRDDRFAAMQVMNVLYGGGMTSKLFMNVREKQSLCYSISSSYYSAKGIILVSAGIDFDKEALTRKEILHELSQIAGGNITDAELTAAKAALISGLQGAHDSPSSIEGYYEVAFLSEVSRTTASHMEAVRRVTKEDVSAMAAGLHAAATFFLKGDKA